MSLRIEFRRQAKEDIFAAYRWYQQQRSGLGEEFLQAVDSLLEQVAANPQSYQIIYKNARRALLPRFPYALYYLVTAQSVKVIACFHLRRNPKQLQRRIK